MFGGLGFSGKNNDFNAKHGVYQNTISRETEIMESNKIEQLYEKVCASMKDKKLIVFTHMPLKDWSLNDKYHNDFVYVSGHDHRNYFYDDGVIRIYNDNQIGYNVKNMYLKSFLIDDTYDWFSCYEDGIYVIENDDYRIFYRGKNLSMDFNRKTKKLYMLKKNNYYCFIYQNNSNSLLILNGGQPKTLLYNDINYYYDNMEHQINFVEKPYKLFHSIQSQLSKAIKKIGGWGRIHGAIVDIDFYNHLFVNPNDCKITPYFAYDMIDKTVYSNILDLLQHECPKLYMNYKEISCEKDQNMLQVLGKKSKGKIKAVKYRSTNMYNISREITKMQKLQSNILTIWLDIDEEAEVLKLETK